MSRRSEQRGRNWGLGHGTESVCVEYTCARGGHTPQVWAVHRVVATGQIQYARKRNELTPEPVDFAEYPSMLFLCPSCGHEVTFTLATVNRHLDYVVKAGRRVATYPL